MISAEISIRIIPVPGKDLGVEISFGEWMMAFGFAEFVIASLLFEYA
jgi:hypothetical protein